MERLCPDLEIVKGLGAKNVLTETFWWAWGAGLGLGWGAGGWAGGAGCWGLLNAQTLAGLGGCG